MINITEKAKAELKKLLLAKVDWPGARLRLLDRGEGRLGLGIDIEYAGDKVVEYEGAALMVVEEKLAERLSRTTLDVEANPDSVQLVLCEHA